ncbi:MAG: 4a-hydroxytetrahydrobiopterin dehydratase [Thermodesulfobacteriota bacterium]
MGLLNDTEINNKLSGLNGWERAGNEIVKSFKFANFIASIGFVNKIAILSEKADHHPDILIQYSNVKITLSTHSEGGLTEKDFNLAGEIEGAFNS